MKKKLLGMTVAASLLALSATSASAAQDKTVSLGYVNGWADSVASAYVAANILETKLHYHVQLKPVSAAILWEGVARGDIDASLEAWLPVTHAAYYKRFKNDIQILHTNFENAKVGLVVPDYMKTQSITDLNSQSSQYNSTITGIDPGAGEMMLTNKAIKEYGLKYHLMPSSGTAMAVALSRAEKAKKPIVVTGWQPHWMFVKWHLHFLKDPKHVYGNAEHIVTFARKGFTTDDPDAANFLKKFQWNSSQIGQVMLNISNGEKPAQAASEWVSKNADLVNQWTK